MCCPDLNCGPNKIPNANTCKCSGCTNSCPPEKRLNAGSCVCECSSFCGPHRNQDPTTCACSACTNKCGENQSLNPNTCECQCKKPCVQFKTQDPESCSCSACTNSCEANEFLNTDTCVCGSKFHCDQVLMLLIKYTATILTLGCPMNEKLTTQYTRVDPDCRPEGFTDCRKVSSSVFCKCVKGFVRHKKNCVLPASTCPKVISMA